jgi:hypothetical protein
MIRSPYSVVKNPDQLADDFPVLAADLSPQREASPHVFRNPAGSRHVGTASTEQVRCATAPRYLFRREPQGHCERLAPAGSAGDFPEESPSDVPGPGAPHDSADTKDRHIDAAGTSGRFVVARHHAPLSVCLTRPVSSLKSSSTVRL